MLSLDPSKRPTVAAALDQLKALHDGKCTPPLAAIATSTTHPPTVVVVPRQLCMATGDAACALWRTGERRASALHVEQLPLRGRCTMMKLLRRQPPTRRRQPRRSCKPDDVATHQEQRSTHSLELGMELRLDVVVVVLRGVLGVALVHSRLEPAEQGDATSLLPQLSEDLPHRSTATVLLLLLLPRSQIRLTRALRQALRRRYHSCRAAPGTARAARSRTS